MNIQAATKALNALTAKLELAKYTIHEVKLITLREVQNRNTGPHVHATCKVTKQFDASVAEKEIF